MDNLDKVITGIECCVTNSPSSCRECPYKHTPPNFPSCVVDLERAALGILKEKAPRVMTLEEVKQWDAQESHEKEPVYTENIFDPDYTWAYVGNFGFHYVCDKGADPYDGYGITWRCWASRPTDKQREATAWNE